MKTYISGPIAGAPGLSREEKLARFDRAELVLREMGHDPLNPLSVEGCSTRSCTGGQMVDGHFRHAWDCWLRYDLIAMLQECDSIAVLPEWEISKGARLEYATALELDWPVIDLTRNAVVLGLPHILPEPL